jgi:hypothetical protein
VKIHSLFTLKTTTALLLWFGASDASQFNPDSTLKRVGDGFYEQKLVAAQCCGLMMLDTELGRIST